MSLSIFRYPGGKTKLLPILMPHIDQMLIGQNSFTDTFVGGGSVLLEVAKKYPNIQLYANDKDYWVYCFWKVISDIYLIPFLDLLKLIEQKPTLEQFYTLRAEQTTDEIRCAYKALYFNRTTFSGIFYSGPIGGKDQKSQYKIDCRYNINTLKTKLNKCRELLMGRTIVSNKSFDQYDQLYTNEPMYLDPPYVEAGKSLYVNYMIENEHYYLGKILNLRKNWVLSYDDCDKVRELYSSHKIIDIADKYCINDKNKWEHKNELVILP